MEWLIWVVTIVALVALAMLLKSALEKLRSAELFKQIYFEVPAGFEVEKKYVSEVILTNSQQPGESLLSVATHFFPGDDADRIVVNVDKYIRRFFANYGIDGTQIRADTLTVPATDNTWQVLSAREPLSDKLIHMYYFVRNNAFVSTVLMSGEENDEINIAAVESLVESLMVPYDF